MPILARMKRKSQAALVLACFVLNCCILFSCSHEPRGKREGSVKEAKRPLIAINTSDEWQGGRPSAYSTRATYVEAVTKAGGLPVLLPANEDLRVAREYADHFDGFVIIGGGDISPQRYGKSPHPTENPISSLREAFDFALIEALLEVRKPFLAICLGCQEVNVALGGTLIQDIASQTTSSLRHYTRVPGEAPPHHMVTLEGDSRVAQLVGTTSLLTNTSHHQAIERLGQGLRPVGWAEDGIIEACELMDFPFGLCIQWHPEAMIDDERHLALFRGLVESAVEIRDRFEK